MLSQTLCCAGRIAQANALLRLGHTERLGVHNWLTGREFGEGDLHASVKFKLRHDAAQLEHLVERFVCLLVLVHCECHDFFWCLAVLVCLTVSVCLNMPLCIALLVCFTISLNLNMLVCLIALVYLNMLVSLPPTLPRPLCKFGCWLLSGSLSREFLHVAAAYELGSSQVDRPHSSHLPHTARMEC